MFTNCTSIDLGKLDTSKTTLMRNVFHGCSALTSLVLPRTGTPAVTDMSFMFWGCSSLRSVDLTRFNASHVTGHGLMDLFSGCSSLEQIKLPGNLHTGRATNMGFMFSGCKSLRSINLHALDTRNVQVMTFMFYGCQGLSSIDLRGFSTASATSLAYMFAGCSGLKSIDVSKFNTSHVTDFGAMFEGCKSLTGLNLSHFNTTSATNTIRMFKGCSALKSLNLRSFKTPKLSSVAGMFQGCTSLTSVDVSRFDTDLVFDFKNMFRGCSSLKKLDISSMVTRKITMAGYMYRPDMRGMFSGCSALGLVVNTANFDVTNSVAKNFSFPARMNMSSWKKGRISIAVAALSMSSPQRFAALSAHAIGGGSNVTLNTRVVNSESVDKTTRRLGTSAKQVSRVTLGSKVKTVKTKSLHKCDKVKNLTIVSKKFTKKSIHGSLKSSHVKKVIICVGGKKKNKAYAKKYKKYLSKKNIGKKVKVVAA